MNAGFYGIEGVDEEIDGECCECAGLVETDEISRSRKVPFRDLNEMKLTSKMSVFVLLKDMKVQDLTACYMRAIVDDNQAALHTSWNIV